jgi:hypothetical protein
VAHWKVNAPRLFTPIQQRIAAVLSGQWEKVVVYKNSAFLETKNQNFFRKM